LDLQYGLPVAVRDAIGGVGGGGADGMVAPVTSVNKEFHAVELERKMEDEGVTGYGKIIAKPGLDRVSRSKPYYERNKPYGMWFCSFRILSWVSLVSSISHVVSMWYM
jgi:hypothetical protein